MRISKISIVSLLAAAATSVAAQQTIRLTIATPFAVVLPFITDISTTFMPAVNRELKAAGNKYQVEWNFAHSGTLFKVPGSLDAMSSGQADIAWIGHVFEPTRLPLQNVANYAPFGSSDHNVATRAVHDMHTAIPALNKQWDALNLVYLSSWSNDGYVLLSKAPITSVNDLKGKKVAGAGPNLNWLKGTGAVGVVSPFSQVYNDAKAGIFDAAISPAGGASLIKLHEVFPYVLKTDLGAANHGSVVANKARFSSLPMEVQVAIRKAADEWLRDYLRRMDKLAPEALEAMTKGGAKVTTLSREERSKWAQQLPHLAQEWATELEAKGLPAKEVLAFYVDYLRRHNTDLVRDWTKP